MTIELHPRHLLAREIALARQEKGKLCFGGKSTVVNHEEMIGAGKNDVGCMRACACTWNALTIARRISVLFRSISVSHLRSAHLLFFSSITAVTGATDDNLTRL